jgi:prolyl-tRNA synthetase
LPITLYQIQVKFRDEIRPRFGVMRGREFSMMDAYSFHADTDSLDEWYMTLHGAYNRIFSRCGLSFRPVLADSGAIGGKTTHEFMVLAESGESVVLNCPQQSCGYAATEETAERYLPMDPPNESPKPMAPVDTPNARTIEEVCTLLQVEPKRLIKTLLYKADGKMVAALIPGDRALNEVKLRNALDCTTLEMADAESIRNLTGADVGFSGPVELRGVEIIADNAIRLMTNFVTGANKDDTHLVNVNVGRDFDVDRCEELVTVVPDDLCPRCQSPLSHYRGVEVGHMFKLGTKYSIAMNATFTAADGTEKPFVMGCYGIGTTRTVAAAIEQHHDDEGISWPISIAPYHVLILPVAMANTRIVETSDRLYKELTDLGAEVLYDDRDERPGVKFKDGDLIGIPFRICVGDKNVQKGLVEIRERRTGKTDLVPIASAARYVQDKLTTANA